MSQSDICVSVNGVSKKFSRSLKRAFVYGAIDITRIATGRAIKLELRESEFWALKDISFDLKRGQSIGIVGLNGSGKTSLLRIIAGILRPTSGSVHVDGVIAPMLALGAGFKPVLSGRENIFLNMSLLGLPRSAIKQKFDEVVDFAELWEAIDAPLGTYSTGMLMRLGFSCAIHTDPQILIVDEILAVGDVRFRAKCRNKITDLRRTDTSMLLVSHSGITVESLCDACLYLEKGEAVAYGKPDDVLNIYQERTIHHVQAANMMTSPQTETGGTIRKPITTGSQIAIREMRIENGNGEAGAFWQSGEPGALALMLDVKTAVANIGLGFVINDISSGAPEMVQFIVSNREIGAFDLDPGITELRLSLPYVGLKAGTYQVKVNVSCGDAIADVFENFKIVVRGNDMGRNCSYFQPRSWIINGNERLSAPEIAIRQDIEAADAFE